jgi:hypothetical protein
MLRNPPSLLYIYSYLLLFKTSSTRIVMKQKRRETKN